MRTTLARSGLLLPVWALLCAGCASLPPRASERALYADLRKIVEVNEDSGWISDNSRLELNLEPALRSVCQTDAGARAELIQWLRLEVTRNGGPAREAYLANGHDLRAVEEALSLERTLALLRLAEQRARAECPFWLAPRRDFAGEQSDLARWVLLGETQAFGTVTLPGPVPALGGGARVLLGRGVSSRLTLALGVDAAASGTFIPSSGSASGVDAYVALATPVLLRMTRFSRLFDVELAPVVRFSRGHAPWPPGARLELGYGFASVRTSQFMSYYMLYAGYEVHGIGDAVALDHTIQLGTKLSVDWTP